jgi:hypothetical protein
VTNYDYSDGSEQQRPSVKLSRNSAGATQIEVKIYDDDPAEAERRAQDIYDRLAAKYPAPALKGAR